jgi:D-3-phosphoglycerate dehydrogenase
VFVTEPAKESPLFGTPNFICTPHLGASTTEAQVNVALQVAEQMADYLVTGGVTNALNMPSLSAEEAPKLRPYMALAEKLGSLVGQLAHDNLTKIAIEVEGAAAQLNPKPITGAVLAGLMKQYSQSVNMVNAPFLAKERGLDVREVRHDREGEYRTLVRVTVGTSQGERSVAGTLFGNGQARLVEIFGIGIEADLDGDMLYIVNTDARASSADRHAAGQDRHQHRHVPPRPPRGRWRSGAAAVGRQPGQRGSAGRSAQLQGVRIVKALKF